MATSEPTPRAVSTTRKSIETLPVAEKIYSQNGRPVDDVSPKDTGSSHLMRNSASQADSPERTPWSASRESRLHQVFQQNLKELLSEEDSDIEEDEADMQEQRDIGNSRRRYTRLNPDPAGLMTGLEDPEGILRKGLVRSRGELARHMEATHENQITIPSEATESKVFNLLESGQFELSPNGHVTGQTDETGNTVIDFSKTDLDNSSGGTKIGESGRENSYDVNVDSLLNNINNVGKESVFANSFLSGIRETPLNFEDNDLSAFFTYRGGSKFNIAAQSTPKKVGETKCRCTASIDFRKFFIDGEIDNEKVLQICGMPENEIPDHYRKAHMSEKCSICNFDYDEDICEKLENLNLREKIHHCSH